MKRKRGGYRFFLLCFLVGSTSGCGVYSGVTPPDPCARPIVYPYEGALKADYQRALDQCHKRMRKEKQKPSVSKVIKF